MPIDFFDKEMDKMLGRYQETYQRILADTQDFASWMMPQLIAIGRAEKAVRADRSRANIQKFMKLKDQFYAYLDTAMDKHQRKESHKQEPEGERIAN